MNDSTQNISTELAYVSVSSLLLQDL